MWPMGVLAFATCGRAWHPVEDVLGTWTVTPEVGKGVPDGPLLGNGRLGAAITWQGKAAVIDLHLGHNGFFAAPVAGASSCGYSPGGRKALAGLTLSLPGQVVSAEQRPANATAHVHVAAGTSHWSLSAWVHALEDVLVVELEGPAAEVQVTLWTFSGCNGPPRPPVSPSTKEDGKPVTKTTGATSDRLPSQVTAWRHFLRAARGNGWPFQAPHFPVRWFGFSASTVSESGAGVFEDAEAMGSCGGLRGPCARGMWHTQKRSALVLQLSTWPLAAQPEFAAPKPLPQLRASHLVSWADFWARSYIYIPDSDVTMFHWYMSQYLLRCSSWGGSSAPGLFGPFVVDDEVMWSGDMTLNYNAEAVYYNAGAANHLEAFEPYFQAILDFLPAARRLAQELYPSCAESLAFPAHILPAGVQLPGVGRGDLGQKQMGLFAAVPFVLYWHYAGRLAFAERVLPFFLGVARFWECNLAPGDDGFLHDIEDCAEEICLPDGDMQPDPAVVLSLLPGFLEALAQMCDLLGADAQHWRLLARRVAPYPTEVIAGREVIADFYGGETQHGRELRLHSGGSVAWGGLFAAFPLGTLHRRSPQKDLDLVHRSLDRFFEQWPGGKQGNSFPHLWAAAGRVAWQPRRLLQAWEAYLTNTSDPKCRLYGNGMVLGCGNTGLENVGGAAFGSELLLQVAGGVLQVFPSTMEGAFRLRAPGPLLVTAERRQGVVQEIQLELPRESEPAVVRTDWLVQSPWPDFQVLVDGEVVPVQPDGVFHVFVNEGQVHSITAGQRERER
ncbi:unnamed protein product, partial [Effrenium voratum]